MSVPANQLPPEILSKVLEHRTRERDLVSATQVCRYWRSTLISVPYFWNHFQFRPYPHYYPDRTLMYLERSKSVPIDVDIYTDLGPDAQAPARMLECFAPHITRIRSLSAEGTRGIIHAASSLLHNNQAQSLQYLKMRSNDRFIHLSDQFLGQYAPSLRSVAFTGVCPTFRSPFLLPNLAEFHLSVGKDTGLLRTSTLFRFLSGCPQLQKVWIKVMGEMLQDIPQGQIISLESLVELDYTCKSADRSLPFLRLPRLTSLRVALTKPGQVQRLADTLPYGGRDLIVGATSMGYYPNLHTTLVDLSGNGVDVSLRISIDGYRSPIGWLSDDPWNPISHIEDLQLEVSGATNFPDDISAFKNLRVIRITLSGAQFSETVLQSLHPDSNMGTPCPSLQEIEYINRGSKPPLRPLVDLVRERKLTGHQLELVRITTIYGCDQDLLEELGLHVGEVRLK